jgi:hypothetical protein
MLEALADRLASPDYDRRFDLGPQIFLDGLERRLAWSQENGEIRPATLPAKCLQRIPRLDHCWTMVEPCTARMESAGGQRDRTRISSQS